jgi:3-methyladenine DNA glycosylase/8-oxoguanine DNA glycosylase
MTLSILRKGSADPTFKVDDDGTVWRGIRTPQGTATVRLRSRPADGEVQVSAWGDGAAWALESVPSMLGADDDVTGFAPTHPVLADAHRRKPHWRVCRTGLVMEALVPAIIEQKVTGQEALGGFRQLVHRFGATHRLWEALVPAVIEQKVTGQEAFAGFRRLVHRYGERAPGPGLERGVWVQPDAETVRRVPSWEWLRMHVDPARSRALVRAATVAGTLERLTRDDADARLRTLPGIGEWTAAEIRSRTFGDPDAVSFGDYHIAKDVGWAVTGTPYDDDELRGFLEPWRPQRNRVVALIHGYAGGRPRRGPRMAPRTHLPVR